MQAACRVQPPGYDGRASGREKTMKTFIVCVLLAALTACATCKSTDSYEVCRTKQRDAGKTRP